MADWMEDDDLRVLNQFPISLHRILNAVGERVRFAYAFGDGCQHALSLELISPGAGLGPSRSARRECADARPRDLGGVPGHQRFPDSIFDPSVQDQFKLWNGLAVCFNCRSSNRWLCLMNWPENDGRRGIAKDRTCRRARPPSREIRRRAAVAGLLLPHAPVQLPDADGSAAWAAGRVAAMQQMRLSTAGPGTAK